MASFQTEAVHVGDHASITSVHCLTAAIIVARYTGGGHRLPTHIANSNLRLPEIDGIHYVSYLCSCLYLCLSLTQNLNIGGIHFVFM
jgi:hypothetical protein